MAVVNGPHELTAKAQGSHEKATLNVEYSIAPFAFTERKKRSKGDKRNTEIETLIASVFESAVMVQAYSRSQVHRARFLVVCRP